MSIIRVNKIQNTTTTDGGLAIDSSGHVQVDGLQMPTAGALSNRNLVINGGMTVAQRGTSTTSDGYQTIDRFRTQSIGATGTITRFRTSLVSGGPFDEGYRYFLRCFKSAASTVTNTSFLGIDYTIEAQDLVNSGWNFKSSSSYVTLSFWVNVNPGGTYSLCLETNDGTAYIYNKTFTVAANTWTKVVQKIPGNANLTVNNDNGLGAAIRIFPHLGNSYNGGTDDSWAVQSTNDFGSSMDSDWWTSTNSRFDLAGVQLEVGSKATAPQHERYSETLAKCQRYFEGVPAGSTFNQGDAICWSGYALLNGTNYATKAFTVEKRAIPTVVMTDNTVIAGFNAATCAVGQAGTRGIRGSAQATGTVGARYFFLHFTADAEL